MTKAAERHATGALEPWTWREAQKPIGVALGVGLNAAMPWWILPAIPAVDSSSDHFFGWLFLALAAPVVVGIALTGRVATRRLGLGLFAGALIAAVVDGLVFALLFSLVSG